GQVTDDLQGRVLDRKYRLVKLIGEGGMGTVWEAEHTMISRKMAVKVMHGDQQPDANSLTKSTSNVAMERFFREAQAASQIGHPNIIEIYDVGTEPDGTTFIVMELLKGVSLEDVLEAEGSLSPRRTVAIILQVLSALLAAHNKSIIHRDLKPDNVYLAVDQRMREEVKLLDFGVAKILEGGDEQLGLTKTGSVLGTPYYLAPEQARGGKDIDVRIDIWSVGVMLYEMLTGRLPFDGDNYNEVLGKILMDDIPPLKDYAPKCPDGIVAVVNKALTKDRDKRYRDVSAMLDDLVPFHDAAREQMSTGAIQVLKSSVAPPPAVDDRFRVDLPDEAPKPKLPRPPRPKRRRPQDPEAVTLDSGLLRTMEEVPGSGRKKLFGLIAAGGAVLAAFVVIMAIVLGGSGGDSVADNGGASKPKPVDDTVVTKDTGAAITPVATPEATPETTPEIDAQAQVDTGKSPEKDIASVEPPAPTPQSAEVTISIKGLPEGARASFDDQSAPGYLPFKAKVSRDKDRGVLVKMRKRGGGGQSGKGGKKPAGWKPNPFGN
ncbi:MAG: protein kinase, partial [Deltaproteobacteria bacterium]|nr:protein kinase [Deltaproteobacteria bacterium]